MDKGQVKIRKRWGQNSGQRSKVRCPRLEVRGRRYAAVGQRSGQKVGSEVTGRPLGRKSEVKKLEGLKSLSDIGRQRGQRREVGSVVRSEVRSEGQRSGSMSEVRGERLEVRGQRGQKLKKFEVRGRFNDKSIRRVSTCASKRLPDSITY